MKKLLLTLAFVLCSCMSAFSQATSLTVDCQNPGWLSNKIGYGDQQTVTNLTVTGYLNATDLEFIGTLIKLHSLKSLDLEQVNVVSPDANMQNVLPIDMFKIGQDNECYMNKIALPLSTTKTMREEYAGKPGCFSNRLYVDTLVMGGPAMPTIEKSVYGLRTSGGTGFSSHVKCIIIREGVEKIADLCFYYPESDAILEKILFPNSMKSIGKRAFNCNNITSIDLPDSIEEIDVDAFRGTYASPDYLWKPDTLVLPHSIKRFAISAFNTPSNVYYFPENIEYIDNVHPTGTIYYAGNNEDLIQPYSQIEIHLKSSTPPSLNYNSYNFLSNSVVYVPKGTSSKYKNASGWKEATIIEETYPVTGITLNQSTLQLDYIGETANLEATVFPNNADNKKVNWTSSNPAVCIVSNGMVVAVGMGTSVVIATTEDGGFMAICIVTVTSATGVSSIEQNDEKTFQVFDLNGMKRTQPQKGINIIRYSDGTSKKILIK